MKVELLDYFGDDLMVANTARVSYGKYKEEFDDKDSKLINYLVKHKHTSPFRHPQLRFRIECPIFVERQLFKHQVGISVNSISGRYVDFSDNYYKFDELRKQSKSSKQGSDGVIDYDTQKKLLSRIDDLIDNCSLLYSDLCDAGVAKEQARAILPLCLETQFIWTGSFLALVHLWNLRLKPDTQKETRDVASNMLELVKNINGNPFKYSLQAFDFANEE